MVSAHTGTYDSNPENTGFFSDNGGDNYSSPYGRFFLSACPPPKPSTPNSLSVCAHASALSPV